MPAAKFRKKPIVIEAIQFTGSNGDEVAQFTLELEPDGEHGKWYFHTLDPEDRGDDSDIVAEVFDKLHSTWVGVKLNQWIIKGIDGEFYPCDADVFQSTYEQVEE